MAIVYVSQTATNGYIIGNDSNDGSTKQLAKLTVESAITEASADDEVKGNDGSYSPVTFYTTNKNLTFSGENAGLTTFAGISGQTRIFHMTTNSHTLAFNSVILDSGQ